MRVLVTGGAGYIGGFMAKRLLEMGHEVTIADSLERGHQDIIDSRANFKNGNLCDKFFVSTLFVDTHYDCVIHFAAFISMGESVQNPYIYFYNNVQASLNIIEEMVQHDVNNFIFSSTAGVYGNPIEIPIPENHPKNPENPYGESKYIVERILSWYAKTKNLSYVILRYFNAAGAALDGSMGEQHNPESHIIPNIIKSVMEKRPFTLFGTDYQTPDGTCVRDYIHVLDLVEGHILSLNKLQTSPGQYIYNVGTGRGHSNKEVIAMVEKVTGLQIKVEQQTRRPGDADILIADVKKIQDELSFIPKYSDLETIVKTAWEWHSKNFKFSPAGDQ